MTFSIAAFRQIRKLKITTSDKTSSETPNETSKCPVRSPSRRSQPSTTGITMLASSSRRAMMPPARLAVTTATSPSSGRDESSPTLSVIAPTAVKKAIDVYEVTAYSPAHRRDSR